MALHGVSISRLINGGGIPQKNPTLNQVYANVLNKPVLIPQKEVTSLGSAVFAFLIAGVFKTIEEAQEALCPSYRTFTPEPAQAATYEQLFQLYQRLYFGFGKPDSQAISLGDVLPRLRKIAAEARRRDILAGAC
jgi:L-ribulokinase